MRIFDLVKWRIATAIAMATLCTAAMGQSPAACVSADPKACRAHPVAKPELAATPTVQLPVVVDAAPRGLGNGVEVIVVSGYKSFMTNVIVDRPGKTVLLVLASYESGRWKVSASRDTILRAILVATGGRSTVDGPMGTPTYAAPALCCATAVESAEFRRVIVALNAGFGVERIDAFRGQDDLPGQVSVSQLDAPKPELTLAGTPVTKPDKTFEFELLATDLRPVRWTNAGPRAPADAQAPLVNGKTLVLPSGVYQVRAHEGLFVASKPGVTPQLRQLPQGFPPFSWATDLAYDSQRGIVSVVSLGGEGFFYRYDVAKGEWLDFRSMNNIDVTSLTYDSAGQRYLGWLEYGILVAISPQGVVADRKEVRNRLPGLLSTIGNIEGPSLRRLTVVAKDGYVALMRIDEPRSAQGSMATVGGGLITHMWTYDPQRDVGWLTYKR
jgi:hypothetical protein